MNVTNKNLVTAALVQLFVILLTGCSTHRGGPGGNVEQQVFDSPQALVAALKEASVAESPEALLKIVGPDGRKLIFSGDEVLDQHERALFAQRLKERADLVPYVSPEFNNVKVMKLRLGRMGNNAGVPLVNDGNGWRLASRYFAPRSVKRRISSNEIAVWRACMEYFEAQGKYAKVDRDGDGKIEYAQRFFSTPGNRDGLYWKTKGGEKSPLEEEVAHATATGYSVDGSGEPKPYMGYLFKILTRQGKSARDGERNYLNGNDMTGGFALVAYPVEWGASGVRTFVVGPYGIIYGKNLGVSTERIVEEMMEFNPDRTWNWIQQPQINDFEEYVEKL